MTAASIVQLAEIAELGANFHAMLRYQVHKCVLVVGNTVVVGDFFGSARVCRECAEET